jgi:probable HAF family extracellular repeat protein
LAFSPDGRKGTMSDLGALDGVYSAGTSINSSGTVVGWSTDGSVGDHALLWQKASSGMYTMSDLNSLIASGTGWTLTAAAAINDAGQIVVGAQGSSGSYALLLTPSTTTLALAQSAAGAAAVNDKVVPPSPAGPVELLANSLIASAALAPNVEPSLPLNEASASTVPPGSMAAATAAGSTVGSVLSQPSLWSQTVPRRWAALSEQLSNRFVDQLLDLSEFGLGATQ